MAAQYVKKQDSFFLAPLKRVFFSYIIRKKALFYFFLPLLWITSAFLQVGCSPNVKKEELHINFGADPESLCPRESTQATTFFILRNVCDGLVRIGRNGEALPALAEKIEKLDGGRRWRFTLRDTCWSDGTPLKAKDFTNSWRMILEKKVPAPLAEQLLVIKGARGVYFDEKGVETLGIEELSTKEILVTLEEANPYFLDMLAVPIFFPLPEKILEQDIPYRISCGPFVVKSWNRGEEIVLKKNPLYWDQESVVLPGIKISIVADPQTQLELFEKAEIDWCGLPTLPLPEEAEVHLDKMGRLKRVQEAKTLMLLFNTNKGMTANKKIRKALSLAIDREALVHNNIISGEPARNLVPPSLLKKAQPALYLEDFKLAKQLWREGCHELGIDPKKPPKLAFSHIAAENFKKKAQALQSQWRENLGIDIELQAYERQIHVQRMLMGDYDIGHFRWMADYPDPLNFLGLFYSRNSGRNYPGWENSSYRHQIDILMRTSEIEEREVIVERAENILAREMPIAPLVHIQTPFMNNPKLRGYYFDSLGFLDLKQAYFESHPSSKSTS